jgi:predicted dehydrogenase
MKMGVVGLSGIGNGHAQAIAKSDFAELAGVCSRREASFEKIRSVVPDLFCTTTYEELLRLEGLEAVVVATPDHLHVEQTLEALRSGKHVLCEKPIAYRVEDGVSMVEAARNAGKALFVGHVCRYAGGFRLAKKMVDDGVIGELFFLESEYAHNYDEVGAGKSWRTDPQIGREQVVSGGCHAIDILRWYGGNPTEVQAYANRKVLSSWTTDDTTVGIYRFPNGAIGKVFVSAAVRRNYTMRTVLYGSKGTIIADNVSDGVTLYSAELNTRFMQSGPMRHPETLGVSIPSRNSGKSLPEQLAAFHTAIVQGKEGTANGESAVNTLATSLATVEAAKTGRAVKIDYPYPDK